MDITKLYDKHSVHIIGTPREPLFKASDISIILDIKNHNQMVRKVENIHKTVVNIKTDGGYQDTVYLTYKGALKVTMNTNSKSREDVNLWICDTVKDLINTGSTNLHIHEEQIENQADIRIKEAKERSHQVLINNFDMKSTVYISGIMRYGNFIIIKFGRSNNIKQRLQDHRATFGQNFYFQHIISSPFNVQIENNMKIHPELINNIISLTFGKSEQTELLKIDNNLSVERIFAIMNELCQQCIRDPAEAVIDMTDKLALTEHKLRQSETMVKILESRKVPHGGNYKYQIYNKDTLKLIHTYNSIAEVKAETKLFNNASETKVRSHGNPQIDTYKQSCLGYRWHMIKQTDDGKVEHQIGETVEPDRTQTFDLIYMIDLTNNYIIGEYENPNKAGKECLKLCNYLLENTYTDENGKNVELKLEDFEQSLQDYIEYFKYTYNKKTHNKIFSQLMAMSSNKYSTVAHSIANKAIHGGIAYQFYWYKESNIPVDFLTNFNKIYPDRVKPEIVINKGQIIIYLFNENKQLQEKYYTSMDKAIDAEHIPHAKLKEHINNVSLYTRKDQTKCYFSDTKILKEPPPDYKYVKLPLQVGEKYVIGSIPPSENIIQIDKNNTRIENVFDSTLSAAKQLLKDHPKLNRTIDVLNEGIRTSLGYVASNPNIYGFVWCRSGRCSPEHLANYKGIIPIPVQIVSSRSTPVYRYNKDSSKCISDKTFTNPYPSVKDTADDNNVAKETINKYIKGKLLFGGMYYFSKLDMEVFDHTLSDD